MATVVVLALSACAGMPPQGAAAPNTPEAKQALVTERAQARWKALISDDMDKAYGYLSPASREVTSLEKFKASTRRGAFREAKIDSVRCDAEACQVRVLVTYDHRLMKGITTPLAESWVLDGGQAWYVHRAQ